MNRKRNLSELERWASIAAGAGLAAYGLSRLKSNGLLYAGVGGLLLRRGVRAHCDLYDVIGVNTAGTSNGPRAALRGARGVNVLESVIIDRPIELLYRFWRNLENLPQFMRHLESVEKVTDSISHWRAKGPAGTVVEWNAEIFNEIPNKLIAWRSLEGSDVVSAGSVNFDTLLTGRGTRVTVHLQYSPLGGRIGAAVARLFGSDAETEIRADLRRFKHLLDADEVPAAI
ncbi:MAG TPA: SRPBCC family protein [Vicinamibacterales bacterium]